MEEAREYERELMARFANEPRVQVLRADGVPIMSDIPASMVVPMPTDDVEDLGTYIPDSSEQPGGVLTDDGQFIPKSQLILPGNVEKQMERDAQ